MHADILATCIPPCHAMPQARQHEHIRLVCMFPIPALTLARRMRPSASGYLLWISSVTASQVGASRWHLHSPNSRRSSQQAVATAGAEAGSCEAAIGLTTGSGSQSPDTLARAWRTFWGHTSCAPGRCPHAAQPTNQ